MKLVRFEKYPNLYIDETREVFYFRKFSALKAKQFTANTKVIGKSNAARAYKVGLGLFNDWLGVDELNHPQAKKASYWFKKHLERREVSFNAHKISLGTYDQDRYAFAHIQKHFGHLPISKVTSDAWDQVCNASRAEVFTKYSTELARGEMSEDDILDKCFRWSNSRKFLIAALTFAKSRGVSIKVGPFENPDPPSRRRTYKSPEIISTVMKQCKPTTWLISIMVYFLGMRPGEVTKVEKSQIEFYGTPLRAFIKLRADQTKTRTPRKVPVPPAIATMLAERVSGLTSKYLFPSRRDPSKPVKGYRRGWRNACVAAGYEPFDIYCLRHSRITDLVNSDANILTLSKVFGTSVKMLEAVYFKERDSVLEKLANYTDPALVEKCARNLQITHAVVASNIEGVEANGN